MNPWRKICCPIDLSPASRPALKQACDLAIQLGAELLLVHVRRLPSSETVATPFAPPPRGASMRANDEPERLRSWIEEAERLAPGRINSVELSGHPADEIVRVAQELGCDVIVMGTHGRTGLKHVAMGSVAEHVVRTSQCPVVVVRHEERGAPR